MVGPGVPKSEITLRSLYSLIKTINQADFDLRLIIIDDHSSKECLENIEKILKICKYPAEIINMETTGNGASLKTVYDWALKNGRDYLFFIEDDYLHAPTCMSEMLYDHITFQKKLNHEVALSPCDNPDNYLKQSYSNLPCNIGLGENRHWRTVTNSTSTFFCSHEILKKYWTYFEVMTNYGKGEKKDEVIVRNKIWEKPFTDGSGAFLLSPIPSLSIHLQYATEFEEQRSPFINWKEWWNDSDWREN
jgi:glycosyltransferase involved in cell wall biosynthesis